MTLLLFPALLTLGTLLIPFVRHFGDHAAAERAIEQETRWLLGHLIVAAAFGLGIVNVLTVISRLQGDWLGTVALVCTGIGGGIQAAGLGADGIAPVVLQRVGVPARQFFDGSNRIIPAVFIAGSLLFGLGQILMVVAVNQSDLLSTTWGVAALLAAIGFSALPAIPSSWSLYATATLSWIIYLPVA